MTNQQDRVNALTDTLLATGRTYAMRAYAYSATSHAARMDAMIMNVRTLSSLHGATPADIQRALAVLESYADIQRIAASLEADAIYAREA